MSIEDDQAYYESILPSLLEQYLNQYVVIKDRALIGVYPDYNQALSAAVAQFGATPVLIKQVREDEPQEVI